MAESVRSEQVIEDSGAQRSTVLVVDDEESFHDVIARYLTTYRVINAFNGWQALKALEKHHVDVVLLDLNMPDTNGLDLLDEIRDQDDDVEVIIITAHSELRNAVSAVKKGAFDFLAKTYESYQQVAEHITRALHHRRRRRQQMAAISRQAWVADAFDLMEKSRAPRMRALIKLARQVARTPLTISIEGESGVGKEVLARYVHMHSERGTEPFVAVNLSAVPATLLESHLFGHVKGAFTGAEKMHVGKFEQADGGTLFLDEIGELDAASQAKLLRVLQEREVERLGAQEASPVDVRVICATNKNLEAEVAAGRFREDLYYRLNVVRLNVPPLRDRTEDLAKLIDLLVKKHATIMRRAPLLFAEDALRALRDYDWPGNIRELENLIMRLVAINPGKTIVLEDIPAEYCLPSLNKIAERVAEDNLDPSRVGANGNGQDKKEDRLYFLARDQFERYLVRLMVRRAGGDRKRAARELGVSISTVKEKMRNRRPDDPSV